MTQSPASLAHATVISVNGGVATVRLNPQGSGCGGCAHGSACGIGRLAVRRDVRLEVDAPSGLRAGDPVGLATAEGGLFLLALLGYVFPAFAIFLGAALGQYGFGGDGPAALCALIFFLLALGAARLAVARRPGLCSISLIPFSDTEPCHEY
ncbi:MAG: SoxR reducing system RseC family protein [Azoarcus sp.]|jgi:sigma-E factor negative regulatory protein RseC|nr:SoxR reducing system RseC family protein [Azoarcus sp.]